MKRSMFKRNILIFLVLISFMQVAVCKSKKNSETAVENSAEPVVDKKAAKNEEKAKKTAEKAAKKEAEEKLKQEEKERKEKEKEAKIAEKVKAPSSDNPSYIGWVDTSSKDVIFRKGIMQIKVKPSMGTFNLGVINAKNRVVPVLATGNEFTTSSFNLKTSKNIYQLFTGKNVQTRVTRKSNSLAIIYTVKNKAEVSINFDCFATDGYQPDDTMKVTVTIKNIGDKKDEFGFKAIFDTVLGESDKYHFYSSENLPIKSEVAYRTMKNQKWFVSKNDKAEMQFIFAGENVTEPELVALASYSTLQKNTWDPDMSSYRAFDNVLSYNNSAVGVIYPSVKLKPKETNSMVFYISYAIDGNKANGDKYLFAKKEEVVEETVVPVIDTEIPVVQEKEPEVIEESKPEEVIEPEVTKNNIRKEQLTPEYIQNLIDRIEYLEKDTSKVDKSELDQLNAELNAILQFLR